MKKIKLNSLSARKMSEKQMDVVNGGYDTCQCSCYYRGYEVGVMENFTANNLCGYHSRKGEPRMMGPAKSSKLNKV